VSAVGRGLVSQAGAVLLRETMRATAWEPLATALRPRRPESTLTVLQASDDTPVIIERRLI